MDKKAIGKTIMVVLGAAFTLGASLIDKKNQDIAIKESVAEEVAKVLSNQTKES